MRTIIDNSNNVSYCFQACLSLSDGEMSGEIEWKLDFSHSGLAVKRMTFKAESAAEDGGEVTHVLTGDGAKVANSPHFGGNVYVGVWSLKAFSVVV